MNRSTNGLGNTKERDNWETPDWLFELLDKQYHFTFDCCATKQNAKTKSFSDDFDYSPNLGCQICWMNPPFSIAKDMLQTFVLSVRRGVAIYRCDNFETEVWQIVVFPRASWVFIPNKRICYEGKTGGGARFPSALIGVGLPPPKNIEGTILIPDSYRNRRIVCGIKVE